MNFAAGTSRINVARESRIEFNRWALRGAPIAVVLIAFSVFSTIVLARDSANLDDTTAEFFRGLRSRRLFRLAEAYCLERLHRGELSLPLRTDLTLELARTQTEHALYSREAEQIELWKQARQVLDDLLMAEPQNPRAVLLEVQRALVSATSGHWRRWMAELQPDDTAEAGLAAQDLNEAIAEFRRLDGLIAEQVRKGAVVRPAAGGLAPAEWRTLGQHVRQHEGLALLDLAQTLPVDVADRTAALLEAQKILKPLADSAEDDDFTWLSRVALMECTRLLGDPLRALRDLQALEKRGPPREFADRLLGEQIRLILGQDRLDEASALLARREQQRDYLSGELSFLQVELLVRKWRRESAVTAPDAEDAFRSLEEAVERLQRESGGYWGMRAELLLSQAREDRTYGADLARLSRQAQAEFSHGKLDVATGLYGKAAAQAHRQDRPDLAFQFGFTRASIEVKGQHWGDAAADLLELVEQYPRDPKAGEAHLLAAYALNRLYIERPTRQRREELMRVLEEHRANYPDPVTRGEATWMLADLAERRGQFTVALKLYQQVPAAHARSPEALAAAGRCYERILGRLRELQQPAEAWEREAVATLRAGLPGMGPEQTLLSRPLAEAAIRLARLLLQRRPPDFVEADRWLLRAIASLTAPPAAASVESPAPAATQSAPDELHTSALQLRIVSLAGQGNFQEARRQLDQLSDGNPSQMLQVLAGLATLSTSDRQDPFRELGALQLQAARKLNEDRAALSEADRRRLDECLGQGYAATGEIRPAIRIYEGLIKGAPRDRPLLTALAELLGRDSDRESIRRAPEIWRKVENLSSAGSDDWLSARYHVCRGLLAAGNKPEACKLLKVTRLLYPKLGGEKLQARFAELENQCGENP